MIRKMRKDELVDLYLEKYRKVNELAKQVALNNLFAFNKVVLKVEEGKDELGHKRAPLADFHEELCDFVQHGKKKKKLILMPRGHLKSTLITIGYSLQRIAKNPNIRILIGNATSAMAQAFLGQIKKHLQFNKTFIQYFGNLAEGADKWRDDMITLKKKGGDDLSYLTKEATVTAYGVGGNLVSQHYDLIILDDLHNRDNISTKDQIEKVKTVFRDILDLLEPGGEMIVIGCLTKDTKVLMADTSWKNIVDVKPGEYVFSYENKRLVKRRVLAMIPQGKDKIYEIKTKRHLIKANGRHPFLVIDGNKTKWKRADELEVDDRVVTIAHANHETSKRHYDGRFLRSDFFYLLGYMFGDGWLIKSRKRGLVGFAVAKSAYPEKNEKVVVAIRKWFGREPRERKEGYYRVDDRTAARWLWSIGFRGKARTKRLPEWLFRIRACYKKAFIDGILAADGAKMKGDGYRLELANKGLVEDIYWIALTCGYRPGRILVRKRKIKAPNSPKKIVSKFYSLCLTYNTRQAFGLNQYNWRWERIESIIEFGEEEVYDLSVEGSHTFIANGFVVHNTRWHYDDLYGWLMDKDNPAGRDFDVFVKRAIDDGVIERNPKGGYRILGGKILWPGKYSRKDLEKLLNEKGSYEWHCQYQNEPVDDELAVFKRAWFKEYDPTEIKGRKMTRFTAVDPAISLKERADYTAIVTIGVDQFENIYILEIKRGHFSEKRIADELFLTYQKWRPISIIMETVAFQKVLQHFIESEMRNRGVRLPIEEVIPESSETKEKRIRSLQPYYMRGNIYHSKGVAYIDYLEDELLRFPKGKNDDIADALAYAVAKSFPPRKRRKEERKYRWLY